MTGSYDLSDSCSCMLISVQLTMTVTLFISRQISLKCLIHVYTGYLPVDCGSTNKIFKYIVYELSVELSLFLNVDSHLKSRVFELTLCWSSQKLLLQIVDSGTRRRWAPTWPAVCPAETLSVIVYRADQTLAATLLPPLETTTRNIPNTITTIQVWAGMRAAPTCTTPLTDTKMVPSMCDGGWVQAVNHVALLNWKRGTLPPLS